MSIALYKGVSGAIRQQYRLETISNNLANLGTAGYKRDAAVFRVPSPPENPEGSTAGPLADRAGVRLETRTDFTPGPLRTTGNPLDLALVGDGFFCIETPTGVRYTRNGSFHLDPDGRIVTSEGYPVLGEGGAIAVTGTDTLRGTRLSVDEQGDVFLGEDSLGTLRIVDFRDRSALVKAPDSLFSNESGEIPQDRPENTRIVQGSIEAANTDAVGEMTRMISAYRLFESYQKLIQTSDEMDKKAVNDLGRLEP